MPTTKSPHTSSSSPLPSTVTLPLSSLTKSSLKSPLSPSPSSLFVSAYSPKRTISLSCVGEGRTKQSHREECDINQIMARYQRTGVLEHVREHPPQYSDATAIDFQTAMDTVVQAKERFAALPSSIRDYCGNDPAAFLDLVTRPEYREEAIRLGLIRPADKQATSPAPKAAEAPQAPQQASEGTSATPPKGGKTNSPT